MITNLESETIEVLDAIKEILQYANEKKYKVKSGYTDKVYEASPEDVRKEIFEYLFEDYCKHCFRHDPDHNCQCWNDE